MGADVFLRAEAARGIFRKSLLDRYNAEIKKD